MPACASSQSPQLLLSILKEPDWEGVSNGLGMRDGVEEGMVNMGPFLLGQGSSMGIY